MLKFILLGIAVGRHPNFAKVIWLFFDMDKMIGNDFAAGLARHEDHGRSPGCDRPGEEV